MKVIVEMTSAEALKAQEDGTFETLLRSASTQQVTGTTVKEEPEKAAKKTVKKTAKKNTAEPVSEPEPKKEEAPVETKEEKTYTLDQLAKAGISLMDQGMQKELQKALSDFGVESLPDLKVEQYGEFANALTALGAEV